MRIHYLQHVPFEDLGCIASWIESQPASVSSTCFFNGDALPPLEAFDCLIIMGGPMNIYAHTAHPWLIDERFFIRRAIEAGKTVLGICLGAQLIADALGASVYPNAHKEIGWFPIQKDSAAAASKLAAFLPDRLDVFHWHGDTFDLPTGAIRLARSEGCQNQGFIYMQHVVGLQFHIETTPQGVKKLIANCGNELGPGPFIQYEDQLITGGDRFKSINSAAHRLMDLLAENF